MEPTEIKAAVEKAVEPVMTAFEAFKQTNDARLSEIEKKGAADPVTTEKLAKIETSLNQFEAVNQRLTLAEKQAKAIAETVDRVEVAMNRIPAGQRFVKDEGEAKARFAAWGRAVVRAHAVGVVNLSADEQKVLADVQNEAKALNVSADTAGGYLAPTEYVREIIKGVTEISPARAIVRVRQTANKSIQIPKRTGQFAAQWVAEQGTKSETTGLAYGLEELPVHELYALIDMSNQMLEDTAFDMESEIRMEASEQFAVAEGAAVVSGSGVGKPEGILTNSSVGETVSGSAATIADADGQANGLMTLFHALKTAYSRNASWALNRVTLGSVRKLKDADKNYIWMPGLANGVPNTILGAAYVEMPDMPNEGAGTYPIAFGDFRRAYTLVDRISMEMLRDPYTQATSGNIRFIFRRRLGGQVVLAEAIRKLKCAAS
jgi:HK97 family phage major capsid protein